MRKISMHINLVLWIENNKKIACTGFNKSLSFGLCIN